MQERKHLPKPYRTPMAAFSQVRLQSGNYEVTVSSPGFASFKETGIYLEPAGTYTVHVALKAGAVTSTVIADLSQMWD
ncbi:MAG TPA: carboxypeptidase-like regulatory domain-containing protein [Acidobacteriaceae bacterium]|nr:carboxypeptidase-like regulatory domain-containing protein [Terriglobia bacterium]HVC90268.1 carboxypeptidase-like regulatory domain-containing protein [Acidobacteriaceae bacterium]